MTFEQHIKITSAQTNAINELEKVCGLSRAQLKIAIDKGALWLTKAPLKNGAKKQSPQRLRRVKKTLSINDELHFYYNEEVLSQVTDDALLLEDMKEYSVWYKPYGMMSQGSKWSDHCTIARWAQKHFNSERNVFVVHRLDKAATGLIIIAHTKKAAQGFSALFEKHDLDKYYQIVVHGHFNNTSDSNDSSEPLRIEKTIDNKKAVSYFNLLSYDLQKNQSLIEVKIETGRKHQIRIHASSIGHPVVGDRLHGGEVAQNYIKTQPVNLQLCAVFLRFTCPVSHQLKEIHLPKNLRPSL